ncbi:MFS transporter [Kiloniella laminariae]|uniref:MFS transporter n=1 Tax=Kiloniella laminariae TaxID=454162 RepID=A0ABT4LJH1_9PROT|nr:MFS transporter [Kiloniella laminariae]MCZ4281259.1 MFS transporter [Kiloniella laminariae]
MIISELSRRHFTDCPLCSAAYDWAGYRIKFLPRSGPFGRLELIGVSGGKMKSSEEKATHSWKESLAIYLHPKVIGMLFLGFSAGLPFLLIFSTLNIWLREAEVSRTEIGFFAWVGIAFSIKVLWAPFADHLRLPILGRLGRRRSWMLLGQIGVIIGLIGMSLTDPVIDLGQMAIFALVVAFSSATQDIGLDAYRIEAIDLDYQGGMAANYQLGWRIGALVAGAGALYMADETSWVLTYQAMAMFMGVGILTVLVVKEPIVETTNNGAYLEWEGNIETRFAHLRGVHLKIAEKLYETVGRAFLEFFARNGSSAIFILIFICIYRISDIIMGNMAGPLYVDLGYSKVEIADVTKIFGFFATMAGAYIGGILVMRMGVLRLLLLGAVLVVITNLFYAFLAQVGYNITVLSFTVGTDNFTAGLAGTGFIAYLSSLVNKSFTATQYGLFSSIMTLPGKFLSGFSGALVDEIEYTNFFIYASVMGIPAILMVLYLMRLEAKEKVKQTDPAAEVFE